MNSVGQKYVYYAPSQMENTDKLRTLIGRFWHNDTENNQIRYGYLYNRHTQKRIDRLMKNYIDGLHNRERSLVSGLPQRDARNVRRRYRAAMLDNSLSEQMRIDQDMKLRLPANWFKIRRRYGSIEGFERIGNTRIADQFGPAYNSFSGDADHEVYEIQLNPKFSENFKFSPTVVLGRRLQEDDKYEYRRYRNQTKLSDPAARKGRRRKKLSAKEKYRADLGRRGSRSFIIKNMFNRIERHINQGFGTSFEDYYFEMTTPIDKTLSQNMNSGAGNIKISTISQDCHYNYYLQNFEKRLANNPDVLESHLPNPYLVSQIESESIEDRVERFKSGENSKLDSLMRKITSLWHRIDQRKISLRVGKNDEQVIKQPRRIGASRKKKRKTTNANSAYMEYLELYSEQFPELEQNYKDRLARQQSNIVFGAQNYDLIQDVCSKSGNVPLGAMVEFTTQKTDIEDLSNKIFKSGLCSIIMLKALEHTLELQENAESSEDYFARSMWKTEFPMIRAVEYEATKNGSMARVLPRDAKMSKSDGILSFNLLDFLERIAKAPHGRGMIARYDGLNDNVESVSTIIHNGSEIDAFQTEMDMLGSTRAKKTKGSLAAFILLGQLKKIAKDFERTWSRLTKGQLGHSRNEIVFYEIEKSRVLTNGESEIIQRFWVPNFASQETIKFFDAQVKFDGTYKYTIHSWVAVLGTKYSYTGMGSDYEEDPNGKWAFGVLTDPFIKLMRMPYKTLEPIQIRDFPPVPPNVDIIPYRAVPDRFIINFNAAVDQYVTKPETILPSDTALFDKCYRSQYGIDGARNLSLFSDDPEQPAPLRFKSDDFPKTVQIFRLEETSPTKWDDFSTGFIGEVNLEEGETSALEFISPNLDYYYTFRSVDIHGNISNPSPIYKVRMNDGQGIFLEVEPYDFEKDKILDRAFTKSVMKAVQITPVFEQIVFKDDRQAENKKTIANQRKIRLGVAQDSIYGKTLKFRITSRKSGRKVDLNVSFTHTHKKPERD